jgi:hypothetical protein
MRRILKRSQIIQCTITVNKRTCTYRALLSLSLKTALQVCQRQPITVPTPCNTCDAGAIDKRYTLYNAAHYQKYFFTQCNRAVSKFLLKGKRLLGLQHTKPKTAILLPGCLGQPAPSPSPPRPLNYVPRYGVTTD